MTTILKLIATLLVAAFAMWLLASTTDKFGQMPLSDNLLYMGLLPWVAAAILIARRPERAKFDLYLTKKPEDAPAGPSPKHDHSIFIMVIAGVIPMVIAVVLLNI